MWQFDKCSGCFSHLLMRVHGPVEMRPLCKWPLTTVHLSDSRPDSTSTTLHLEKEIPAGFVSFIAAPMFIKTLALYMCECFLNYRHFWKINLCRNNIFQVSLLFYYSLLSTNNSGYKCIQCVFIFWIFQIVFTYIFYIHIHFILKLIIFYRFSNSGKVWVWNKGQQNASIKSILKVNKRFAICNLTQDFVTEAISHSSRDRKLEINQTSAVSL